MKSSQQKRMFARLTRVDEAQRMVFGRMIAEEVDKAGEIFDYGKSKPHFERWSKGVAKDTGGKSLGNVRAMHGKIAAGVLKQIDFLDKDKAIDIGAKIVDDAEWAKCLEGVYTGFSIGGSYVDRKTEKVAGKDVTRYVADPVEVSLVDRPMVPSCKFFDIQRADGSVAKVEFKLAPTREEMVAHLVAKGAKADELAKKDDVDIASDYQLQKIAESEAEKAARTFDLVVNGATEPLAKGVIFEAAPVVGSAIAYSEIDYLVKAVEAGKLLVEPAKTEQPTYEIEGSEAEVQQLLRVMKDGKLKISDVIVAAERAARVQPLCVVLPWEVKKAEEVAALTKIQAHSYLRKGLVCAANFAYLIDSLRVLSEQVEYEQILENDASALPGRLKACIDLCGKVLGEMVAEEIQEIVAGTDDGNRAMYVAMSERITLKKRFEGRHDALALLIEKAFPPKKTEDEEQGAKPKPKPEDTSGGAGEQQTAEDVAFATKLHAVALKLGATCDKVAAAAIDLAKIHEHPEVAAAIQAAVDKAIKPLQAKIDKLPAPATIKLRAVSKADDVVGDETDKTKEAVVTNADGTKNESASLIKQAHRKGGQPAFPS